LLGGPFVSQALFFERRGEVEILLAITGRMSRADTVMTTDTVKKMACCASQSLGTGNRFCEGYDVALFRGRDPG